MITWEDKVRVSGPLEGKTDSIKKRVEKRRFTSLMTFCVALAVNSDNLFDIYNMGELLFRYHRDSDTEIHIVGLAHSKPAAIEMVKNLVQEIYDKTGEVDVRGYFLGEER